MKRALTLVILVLTFALTSFAQLPTQFEIACPAGYDPGPNGKTLDPITGQFRAWFCIRSLDGDVASPVFSSAASVNKKPWVDVIRDCGAKGDGVTDDYAAIAACIAANPGKTIYFPKTGAASIGGGAATNFDYYSSNGPFTLTGNGQTLLGDHVALWSGGTAIKFAAGKSGVLIPANCSSCSIKYMEFNSLDNGVASAANGIEVRGGQSLLEGITVDRFGNHCVYINGQGGLGYNTDLWTISYAELDHCGANGLYVNGNSANAGIGTRISVIANGAIGIEDTSTLGNTYIQPHADSNATMPYKSIGVAGHWTWINPYTEGASLSQMSYLNNVIGGVMPGYSGTGIANQPLIVNNGYLQGSILGFKPNQDVANVWTWFCGKTVDQTCEQIYTDHNGNNKWGIRDDGTNFYLWNYTASIPNWNWWLAKGDNHYFFIRGLGTGGVIFNYASGTGGHCEAGGTSSTVWCLNADASQDPNEGNPGVPAANVQRWFASSVDHAMHCKSHDGSDCMPLPKTGKTDVLEIAAPANPAAGYETWWADSATHTMSCKRSDGSDCTQAALGALILYKTPSAQTVANIGTTTILASANAPPQAYRLSWYTTVDIAGSGCTGNSVIDIVFSYTDPSGASSTSVSQGYTITTNGTPGASLPGFGGTLFTSYILQAKAGTAIQYSTIYTVNGGCTTAPTYHVLPILEQL